MNTNKNIYYVSYPVACAVTDQDQSGSVTWNCLKNLVRRVSTALSKYLDQYEWPDFAAPEFYFF